MAGVSVADFVEDLQSIEDYVKDYVEVYVEHYVEYRGLCRV
jgi:hypothetical protein